MRKYPAFIIDRSRRSDASRFSDDFVVCTDKECGFIARAYKIPKSRREEQITALQVSKSTFSTKTFDDVTVVLEIEQYLHEPVAHSTRVPSLLKKAFKAYLYGELDAVSAENGAPYEQLAAVEDVIRLAESQYDRLVEMNGKAGADRFIASLKGAKDSLSLFAKIIESNNA